MEKGNKKELITYIVDRLKEVDELPYKDGAWENFQQQQQRGLKKMASPIYWVASAAAVLIIAFFGIQQFQHKNELPLYSGKTIEDQGSERIRDNKLNPNLEDKVEDVPNQLAYGNEKTTEPNYSSVGYDNNSLKMVPDISKLNSVFEFNAEKEKNVVIAFNPLQTVKQISVEKPGDIEPIYSDEVKSTLSYSSSQTNTIAQIGKTEMELKNKKFQFSERFDLGMFVAPNNTNDKFNFGGGLLLGYKLNKNITVRTGLSFNRYEVGKLKDPVSNDENQVLLSQDAIQEVVTTGLVQRVPSNALILPNMNAITGNIQSLEVPLEFKLSSKSGFYATSGLTYAMVLDQDRMVHYIDNSNTEVFPGGIPGNGSYQEFAVKPVSKAIKTSEKNVKTSGFGGFVNFSVGKDVKMNKTMSLSVEPYVKLPVGNFRSADMNYTHGGIRVITNF